MRRRGFFILGVVLGGLALALILIWPAAPLWERLGLRPRCIQGTWPDLQIAPCPTATATPDVAPRSRSTPIRHAPIPIIVDDDGSPDGVIALLYFLRNPLFEVEAVTVSCGEAHPEAFAGHLQRLLAGLGRTDIPIGAGRAVPLEGDNAFPAPWRQASDDFWGISYPQAPASRELVGAAELIVKTIHSSAEPVRVFVSGTHTNLAEALRLDPSIAGNIRDVHVMGGSIYVPGNIQSDWPEIDNSVAEWNIWVDPVAADEVFTSGMEIHLVPLDATDQILWTDDDARLWAVAGSPEGTLASDLLRWMIDTWSATGVYVWDLATAVHATDPTSCPEVPLSVDVAVAPGSDQGRTATSDQLPNMFVCLAPDSDAIRAMAAGIFGR